MVPSSPFVTLPGPDWNRESFLFGLCQDRGRPPWIVHMPKEYPMSLYIHGTRRSPRSAHQIYIDIDSLASSDSSCAAGRKEGPSFSNKQCLRAPGFRCNILFDRRPFRIPNDTPIFEQDKMGQKESPMREREKTFQSSSRPCAVLSKSREANTICGGRRGGARDSNRPVERIWSSWRRGSRAIFRDLKSATKWSSGGGGSIVSREMATTTDQRERNEIKRRGGRSFPPLAGQFDRNRYNKRISKMHTAAAAHIVLMLPPSLPPPPIHYIFSDGPPFSTSILLCSDGVIVRRRRRTTTLRA